MTHEEITALLDKADAHLKKSEFAEAEALANEVLASGLVRKEDEARALYTLGGCCFRTARMDEALDHLHNALTAAEDSSDLVWQSKALSGVAEVQAHQGDYKSALSSAERALELAEDAKVKIPQLIAVQTLGNVYLFRVDYSRALDYFARALAISEEIGAKPSVARSLGSIGWVHQAISDNSQALDYFSRALSIAEEIGDRGSVATTLGNIGILYWNIADYPRALDYMAQANSLEEEIGNKVGIAINLGNMGNAYFKLEDYPRALEYHKRALELSTQIGALRPAGYWMHGIASVECKLGHLDIAYQGFLDTLHHQREVLKTNELVAETLAGLGSVLIEQGKTEQGLARLEEALVLAEELGSKQTATEAHKDIADAYSKLGDMAKAYEHITKHLALDKEIFSEESKKSVEKFNMRVTIAEKQRETDHERHEKELEQMKREQLERELSNTTLHFLAQTESISNFRNEMLQALRKLPPTEPVAKELREKLKALPAQSVDWKKFDAQFKAAHPEFTKALIEKYPDLTAAQVRICSLIRMNMKSEEIARLFSLTERNIENHRYRIRGKMKLKRDQDLALHLAKL
jgi:tetratricopeptide (TPR) repeat protein